MKKPAGDLPGKEEIIIQGIPASPGIVIGPGFVYRELFWEPEPVVIPRRKIAGQINRFRKSVQSVHANLTETYQKTRQQLGEELAEILEMQIAFLEDQIFLKEVEDLIEKKRYEAAYAAFTVFRKKKEYFLKLSNEYFRDRAFDIQSLKAMIVKNLLGKDKPVTLSPGRPSIVIADNLSPADTVQFYHQQVLGLATNTGGKTSHTAIVARSLSVPAVVGLNNITEKVQTGDIVILDGTRGTAIVHPSPQTIAAYQEQQRIFCIFEEELLKESALPVQTRDGKRIYVHANIEFEEEIPQVLQVGAEGVGLFRTEGFFLSHRDFPSEEEQARLYQRVAEQLYPHKVVIRTLDIGGDKMLPGVGEKEDNPFLGWRAIRFWLDHKIGFLSQLKAILRANVKGNVQILLPMVSGLDEINQVKELLHEARDILHQEGKACGDNIDLGIMIEIPSVVMLADVLAQEVDFFSIGTNDLVQYTLAVDRGNARVARLYSHFHPAILRMLQITLEAGRQANIPVAMCGEMAGDPLALPVLLAMGFDNLSASHSVIPEMKRIIRRLSVAECEHFYEQIKRFSLTQQVVDAVRAFFQERFPELYERK